MKEAVLKSLGIGLSLGTNSKVIAISREHVGCAYTPQSLQNNTLMYVGTGSGDYLLAVAPSYPPRQKLMERMLLMEREDGIKLLSINLLMTCSLSEQFAGAYQTVFADHHQERIYPTEALAVIQQHLSIEGQITVIAVQGEMSVIGFGMAVRCIED